MPTTATSCPPVKVLAQCAVGKLPAAEAAAVRRHASDCSRCALMLDPAPTPPTGTPAPPILLATHIPRGTPMTAPDAAGWSLPNMPTAFPFLRPAQAAGDLGVLGPYRVHKELGSGGMGVVFQATDPALNRTVALKVMKPEFGHTGEARERFLREARAVAAVEHPNIVTVYQVGEDNGAPFLAMQFLKGETLLQRLARERQLGVLDVLRIGGEIAAGLAAAHAAGVVHRDIKPANVWLDADRGRVKILDFGLARANDDRHLTRTGTVVGTPAYMSPEQAAGRPVDARSDLFSLGSVLYHLCTGRLPFAAPDELSMLLAVATETPPPVTEANPDVPEVLVRLIVRLMQKHPDDRSLTAAQVAELCEFLAIESSAAVPQTPHDLPPTEGGNWKLGAALAVIGVLAFAGYVYRAEVGKLFPALARAK